MKFRLWKQKSLEKKAKQNKHVKQEARQMKQKLGFLGSSMRAQEQAYVRIIKPTCANKIMCTQVLAQKALKTQPSLKH